MIARFVFGLVLAGLVGQAHAQLMVVACPGEWGSSSNCGGCSAIIWTAPDSADKVKSTANDFWRALGTLPTDALVIAASGKTEGQALSAAECKVLAPNTPIADLSSSTPSPAPTPTPTGSASISWVPPVTNTDGSALTNLSGYRIDYWLGANPTQTVTVGAAVRSYTLTGLAPGMWVATVTTLAGTAQSVPTNLLAFTVSAPEPTPTPTPGPVVIAVVSGLNMSPVFGISSIGSRGGTVLGFVPVGTPCTGSAVYSYRGQTYHRFDPSRATWWASTATTSAAVACK